MPNPAGGRMAYSTGGGSGVQVRGPTPEIISEAEQTLPMTVDTVLGLILLVLKL